MGRNKLEVLKTESFLLFLVMEEHVYDAVVLQSKSHL